MTLLTPPNVNLHQLGRGVVRMAMWSGGSPGEYADAGNCSRFEVRVTEETIDHYCHRSGLRARDRVQIRTIGYMLAFNLDEIGLENLARATQGQIQGDGRIEALLSGDTRYAVRFESDNPNAAGENQAWDFWKVKLSPASALGLASGDWSVLPFAGQGESDTVNHPDSPFFRIVATPVTP